MKKKKEKKEFMKLKKNLDGTMKMRKKIEKEIINL